MNHFTFYCFLSVTVVFSFPLCPEIKYDPANVTEVSPGDDLNQAFSNAQAGSVFLLNSGTYKISSNINVRVGDIVIRSKSGIRSDVILDGNNGSAQLARDNFTPEIFSIKKSNVTLAHLTIRYARDHGIHVSPESDGDHLTNVRLYDVRVMDCGQQLIKVNSNGNESNLKWVDSSSLECSLLDFENNSVMQDLGTHFYTGGLDAHGASYWTVRNNEFRGIERDDKLMEHAIHFWSKSRGNLIENNIFVGVYRAIGLGMKTEASGLVRQYPDGAGDTPYFDHVEGIIRNNVIYNSTGVHLESGIELMNVKDVQVYHNTVLSEAEPFSSIEYRWENTTVVLKNNVVSHTIKPRNGASAELEGNVQNAVLSYFQNPAQGDFHLSTAGQTSLAAGVSLSPDLFGMDMDGEIPGVSIYAGADQVGGVSSLLRMVPLGRGLGDDRVWDVKGRPLVKGQFKNRPFIKAE